MGDFLAVSAFRGVSSDRLCKAAREYIESFGVGTQSVSGSPLERTDCLFYEAAQWTLVLWPRYFNIHDDAVCTALSKSFNVLCSIVHFYDGDYWAHLLCESGEIVDRFCSHPRYFSKSPEEGASVAALWKGNSRVLATKLAVEDAVLAPYLVHLDSPQPSKQRPGLFARLIGRKEQPQHPSSRRAYPDDEFALDNYWVFTDFWRRVGIQFPSDVSAFKDGLRLSANFQKKLPTTAEVL